MEQMTFSDFMDKHMAPPLSRTTDPIGSFEAADKHFRTGTQWQHFKIIYTALKDHPGSTSKELTRHCSLDRHQIARRLPEMARMNLVEKGPSRICEMGGTRALTWSVK